MGTKFLECCKKFCFSFYCKEIYRHLKNSWNWERKKYLNAGKKMILRKNKVWKFLHGSFFVYISLLISLKRKTIPKWNLTHDRVVWRKYLSHDYILPPSVGYYRFSAHPLFSLNAIWTYIYNHRIDSVIYTPSLFFIRSSQTSEWVI